MQHIVHLTEGGGGSNQTQATFQKGASLNGLMVNVYRFTTRKLNHYIEIFIDFIDGALLKGSWSRGNLPRLPVDSTCQHIFHLEQSIS